MHTRERVFPDPRKQSKFNEQTNAIQRAERPEVACHCSVICSAVEILKFAFYSFQMLWFGFEKKRQAVMLWALGISWTSSDWRIAATPRMSHSRTIRNTSAAECVWWGLKLLGTIMADATDADSSSVWWWWKSMGVSFRCDAISSIQADDEVVQLRY